MGRVRRYKKLKAMDPFAKGVGSKKGRKSDDRDRNLPPEIKNHQAQRMDSQQDGRKTRAKRRLPQWAQDELKETAKRVREEHSELQERDQQPQPQRPAIEGKREDETMRQFNQRVREGTAKLLKENFQENSATRKKRKKYLDEKKRKNKLKKQGLWEEVRRRNLLDEENDADNERRDGKTAAPEGGKRRSGGSSSGGGGGGGGGDEVGLGNAWRRANQDEDTAFPGTERIRFGEVVHAPPDLAKIPKPKGLKDQGQAKPWVRGSTGAPRGGAAPGIHRNDLRSEQFGKKGASGAGETDGMSDALRRQRDRAGENAKKAQKRQMEEMRQRVQEAYTGLKKKRRAGQTQYVSSDL